MSFQNPAHKEMLDFLGRIVGYYKQDSAKKFLVYGQLLRPLEFDSPSPMQQVIHGDPDAADTTDTGAALAKAAGQQYPALMSGVFRAPDGELGVFLANASDTEIAFKAALDPARYGLPAGAAIDVEKVTSEGTSSKMLGGNKGSVPLNGSLPARGLILFRLKLASR